MANGGGGGGRGHPPTIREGSTDVTHIVAAICASKGQGKNADAFSALIYMLVLGGRVDGQKAVRFCTWRVS